ncbi:hypothetical protein [Citrobacter sp. Cm046]|uniref:hypothetical protein n=1 Tax=Citrobacter sp. Cm046 TaxID=2985118 RepID=UPI0025791948|nr:hypothetical protein [Citrobacter sp. Cm046]MDM2929390.1 hypothetical protein [Citrobacter sp. Cm046]
MMDKANETEKIELPVQNRMSPKGLRNLRFLFHSIAVLMFALVIILDKSDIKNKDVWVSIGSTTCVSTIYLLAVYYHYVSFPEKQKKLKAIVDAFSNALALIAIIITFISVVVTGKASALYVDLATVEISNITFGVIIGVLCSRVLFPFWDIYSAYRKV